MFERVGAGISVVSIVFTVLAFPGSGVVNASGFQASGFTAPADPALAETEHVCSSCHGMAGDSGTPEFPNLAGQRKDYLVTELTEFRDRRRAGPGARAYMWGMAGPLSDQRIEALAAWYSAQIPVAGQPGDPEQAAAGKRIFEDGIVARDVPACGTCHGQKAEGAGAVPRLAGQHRDYLEAQLAGFASRANENNVMYGVAKNLSPEQIGNVSTYLASQ